jgi:DNA-binding PadR family transcriptional regulator
MAAPRAGGLTRLEAVVLGLLVDEPAHGYALKARLAPGMPRERQVNDGVLYPLLARLEERGLTRHETKTGSGPGPPRRVFHATAAGRRAFAAWLRSDAGEGAELDYELFLDHPLLKLLFADHLSTQELERKIESLRAAAEARLAALDDAASLSVPSPSGVGAIVLELGRSRERALIDALDRIAG